MVRSSEEPPHTWDRIYDEYFERLCFLVKQRLTEGDGVKANETVSEAFKRVIGYIKDPLKITNLPGYLWVTSRRVWLTRQRKERAGLTDSLEQLVEKGQEKHLPKSEVAPDLELILQNDLLFKEIQANKGPLNDREEFLLALHLQGYSCDEIAGELEEDQRVIGADLNAVRNKIRYRLQRARQAKADANSPRLSLKLKIRRSSKPTKRK
jgi:DNA-directed RNA polymerase specialized sigma24 family protein